MAKGRGMRMARPGGVRAGTPRSRAVTQRAKPILQKANVLSKTLKQQTRNSASKKKQLANVTRKSVGKIKKDVGTRKAITAKDSKKERSKKKTPQSMGEQQAMGQELGQMGPEMGGLQHMGGTDAPMLDHIAQEEMQRDLPQLERAEQWGNKALAEANRGILDPETMQHFEMEERKAVGEVYQDAKKSDAVLRDQYKALQLLERHLLTELQTLRKEMAGAKNDNMLRMDVQAKIRSIEADLANIKFMLRLIKNEDMEERKTIQTALELYKTIKTLRGAEVQERQAGQQQM